MLVWIFSLVFGNTLQAAAATAENSDKLDQLYKEILSSEKETLRRGEFTEDLASGLAALTVGLYGYYNDDRGMVTKLFYGATQTAGVLLISQAIRDYDRPSLLLSIHKRLKKTDSMKFTEYQRMLVRYHEKTARADQYQLAYTGLILGSMYGYSAYRERSVPALRNIFTFLSANFLVVSAVNFGRLTFAEPMTLSWQADPVRYDLLGRSRVGAGSALLVQNIKF
ncbi:MAG: hypothetical protein EOP04_04490 [Proteobacteria bacterium]|nr:MAG: hypothetical protein EOP04_04490 [Pseudomonadota bacterium]